MSKYRPGGKEEKIMAVVESELREYWNKTNCLRRDTPPAVDLESDSLEDLAAWGAWVRDKGGISKEDSRRILERVRRGIRRADD